MDRLFRLYEASPAAAFAELENDLDRLQTRLAAMSVQAEALRDTFENALKALTERVVASPAPTRWTYDARLPNLYFDNVFEPEITPEAAKRWVRRLGSLTTRLALPRSVQYDFSVAIVNFAAPECRASFRLAVDGEVYPWLSQDGNLFSTVILEDPQADGLAFQLLVDTDVLPEDRDVSFSFSTIDIVRRGAAMSGG